MWMLLMDASWIQSLTYLHRHPLTHINPTPTHQDAGGHRQHRARPAPLALGRGARRLRPALPPLQRGGFRAPHALPLRLVAHALHARLRHQQRLPFLPRHDGRPPAARPARLPRPRRGRGRDNGAAHDHGARCGLGHDQVCKDTVQGPRHGVPHFHVPHEARVPALVAAERLGRVSFPSGSAQGSSLTRPA